VNSRLIGGFVLACAIALIAKSRRTLSLSGAIAAVFVATACTAAGWSWAWMLIAFFVSSTLLSKVGESKKRLRTGDIVEKGGDRDAWQVLANGGVFAICAILSMVWPSTLWWAAGAGAIGTAIADTWATEIGTLSNHDPRSMLSGRPVPVGTSGGVTVAGFLGGIAGALSMAALAAALAWPSQIALAAIVGGISGMLIDSILGATVQEKRWCDRCGRGTERAVHGCGTVTVHFSGVRWISNDVVNLASSIGGAIVGIFWLR
jgi:uncharacterized protein (TIGR00297 family)